MSTEERIKRLFSGKDTYLTLLFSPKATNEKNEKEEKEIAKRA